ncbi:MFS transporter [Streptomyces lunalinharesii]|uniref:MFS transporter n=1 Tax=Streptomyces lunalinharesii TaxID=333384 RepID=A0ABN3RQY3_9ACTN
MRKWGPLVAICLGTFMLLLDVTIVLVALPAMSDALGTDLSGLQWVIDGYALALAAALLGVGMVADIKGRRPVYLAGLVLFAVASLACGLASSTGMLIAARIVQGLGAAAMFTATLSLLTAAYTGRARSVALGVWGAVASGAAALGPVLGGLLTQGLTWRWIFFINLPIAAATVLLTQRVITERPVTEPAIAVQRRRMDVPGLLLFALAGTMLVYGLTQAHGSGWGGLQTLFPLGIFLVAAVAFVLVQRRSAHPMLDLALFRQPTFVSAVLAIFVGQVVAFGFQPYTSVWLQSLTGLSPLRAGLVIVPQAIAAVLVSALGSRALARVPLKARMLAGLALIGVGALGQAVLHASAGWAVLVPGLIVSGLGVGLLTPASSALAMEAVDSRRSGMASGAYSTFQQLGYALGVAVFGTLTAARMQHELTGHVPDAHRAAGQLSAGTIGELTDHLTGSARAATDHLLHAAFASGLNATAVIGAVLAGATVVLITAVRFCAHTSPAPASRAAAASEPRRRATQDTARTTHP